MTPKRTSMLTTTSFVAATTAQLKRDASSKHSVTNRRPRHLVQRPPTRTRTHAQSAAPSSSPATVKVGTEQKSNDKTVISSLEDVSYKVGGGVTVVEDISLDIYEGEIVCMLGPSGSGKSSLMRILTGLVEPSSGKVLYRGSPFDGPNPGASIVFQNFALYPWLTVLENVELGLRGSSRAARARNRRRAMATIDIIGLDGYENAYPRELSGGMRQRVGFARALAVEPELLCMDEPFSALDVLTAENLRSELLRLWMAGDVPTNSVLIVTHGIEEAVALADRIVVLGRDPGHIRTILPLDLPHPRNRKSYPFQQWVDLVYTILSEDEENIDDIIANARAAANRSTPGVPSQPYHPLRGNAAYATPDDDDEEEEEERYPLLPGVRIGSVAGLLAFISGDPVDLYLLGQRLQLDVDDLYPIIEAAEILSLIVVDDGDVRINDSGLRFLQSSIDDRKLIVKEGVLKAGDARLIQQIYCMLQQAGDKGELPQELIFDAILARNFSPQESRRQLEIAIEWGRFAELFGYEASTGTLFLDTGDVGETEKTEN